MIRLRDNRFEDVEVVLLVILDNCLVQYSVRKYRRNLFKGKVS